MIAPPSLLGRITGGTRVAALGATLLGTVIGGICGQTIGWPTLVIGAVAMLLGAFVLLRSPVALRRAA